jgi:hypothetical protein
MSQADDGANGVLEKKGRLRCHKRPKSREERPVRTATAERGRCPLLLAKTIARSSSNWT